MAHAFFEEVRKQDKWNTREADAVDTLWLCQQFAIENGHRNSGFSH